MAFKTSFKWVNYNNNGKYSYMSLSKFVYYNLPL
jgi:hypothetical protein